mmetsp:Transcript_93958/g.218404  ORF Transcript_93958/g.218404 Transcript_93958/m.218404 type:complete len:168 (-) Transcript_93958:193-696(-)
MLGYTTLRYRISTSLVTRLLWANSMVRQTLRQQMELLGCFHPDNLVDEHVQLLYDGPRFFSGAVLDFDLDKDGVGYFMNGRYINKRGNKCSSRASIASWFIGSGLSDDFASAVFQTLELGLHAEPPDVTAQSGSAWLAWAFVMSVGCLIGVVCLCFSGCVLRKYAPK